MNNNDPQLWCLSAQLSLCIWLDIVLSCKPISYHEQTYASGLATTLAPAVATALFITFSLVVINCKLGDPFSTLYLMVIIGATGLCSTVSVSSGQLLVFKITFFILVAITTIWLITVGSLLFAVQAFSTDWSKSQMVTNNSIYMSTLALVIVLNVTMISPALLLLQPF